MVGVFVGDTHGYLHPYGNLLKLVPELTYIIQVGDFGYWDHTKNGRKFCDGLSEMLAEAGVDLFFIRGNHENHEMLAALNDGQLHGENPIEIRERISWLPDGCLFEHDGIRFLVIGGAVSVDRADRTQGSGWWPSEVTTHGQVLFATREELLATPPDVILSHDGPVQCAIETLLGWQGMGLSDVLERECYGNRMLIGEVLDYWSIDAKLLVHGHYHNYHETNVRTLSPEGKGNHVKVMGLGSDGFKNSWKLISDYVDGGDR